VLPEPEHKPSGIRESLIGVTVPLDVAYDFFRPISRIHLGWNIVLRTAVPIAAVDEDSYFRWSKNHVGCPTEAGKWACADAVAQPLGMDESPDPLLRLSVAVADRLHVAAPRRGRSPGAFWRYPLRIIVHAPSLDLRALRDGSLGRRCLGLGCRISAHTTKLPPEQTQPHPAHPGTYKD
jgi:hypothetical protein